jgi:hypothetical protein
MLKRSDVVEPALAFSIAEFCTLHRISRPYFYKIIQNGIGPRTMAVGGRTLISVEAAEAWRREREAAPPSWRRRVREVAA